MATYDVNCDEQELVAVRLPVMHLGLVSSGASRRPVRDTEIGLANALLTNCAQRGRATQTRRTRGRETSRAIGRFPDGAG